MLISLWKWHRLMCKEPLAHAPRPIKTNDVQRIAKLRRGLQDIVDVDALSSSGQWSTPAKIAREVLEEGDDGQK